MKLFMDTVEYQYGFIEFVIYYVFFGRHIFQDLKILNIFVIWFGIHELYMYVYSLYFY